MESPSERSSNKYRGFSPDDGAKAQLRLDQFWKSNFRAPLVDSSVKLEPSSSSVAEVVLPTTSSPVKTETPDTGPVGMNVDQSSMSDSSAVSSLPASAVSSSTSIPAASVMPSEPTVQSRPEGTPEKRKRKPARPSREEGQTLHNVLDLMDIFECGKSYSLERLTELLRSESAFRRDIALVHHVFETSRRLIVVTGAGISVAAGIPDFRSQDGLFTNLKSALKLKSSGKSMFDASVYHDDESTSNFHTTVRDLHQLVSNSDPTPFHHYLNQIAARGHLARMYTQNIDCLDTDLDHLKTIVPLPQKAPFPTTVQLHGSLNLMVCSKCQWSGPLEPSLFTSGDVPDCAECTELETVRQIAGKRPQGVGKLRPRIVLYNEANPDAEAIGAVSEADLTSRPGPDGLIVVGTSFKIPGVRRLVRELAQAVHSARGAAIWINTDTPSHSQISSRETEATFDLIVRADCQSIPPLMSDYPKALDLWKNSKRRKRAGGQATAPNSRPNSMFQITKRVPTETKAKEPKIVPESSIPVLELRDSGL